MKSIRVLGLNEWILYEMSQTPQYSALGRMETEDARESRITYKCMEYKARPDEENHHVATLYTNTMWQLHASSGLPYPIDIACEQAEYKQGLMRQTSISLFCGLEFVRTLYTNRAWQ